MPNLAWLANQSLKMKICTIHNPTVPEILSRLLYMPAKNPAGLDLENRSLSNHNYQRLNN